MIRRTTALLSLLAALVSCAHNTAPTAPTAPTASSTASSTASGTNPYAGGVTHAWSDAGPLSADTRRAWVGVTASRTPPAATVNAQAITGGSFLSDASWTSATNGWGPVEKDMSNGEQGQGDGHPLTIAGQTFARGLGVHASSDVSYALNGGCTRFTASVGVDDETAGRGSVVFQLWGATKLYDSGVRTGSQSALPVSVDLTGVSTLRLVVVDDGDGLDYDHADWGNAAVSCTATSASTSGDVSDLTPLSSSNGWGPFEKNMSNGEQAQGDGHPLTIAGQTFLKGLGVHANSRLTYALGTCSTFSASVGIDDETGGNGSVVFQLWSGAAKLYDSGVRTGRMPALPVSVDVTGVQSLTLAVVDDGNGLDYDHADWGGARLTCAPAPAPVSSPSGTLALSAADAAAITDRLVFNRIHTNPGYSVHDRGAARLTNTGAGALNVTGAALSAGWALGAGVTFPVTVQPGQSASLPVVFTADLPAGTPTRVFSGTLTVSSDDPAAPQRSLPLGGLWQEYSESVNGVTAEPTVAQVMQAYGEHFNLTTPSDAAPLTGATDGSSNPSNIHGAVRAQGDEVLSARWAALDASRPVSVLEIGAWGPQSGASTLGWATTGGSAVNAVLERLPNFGQSVLPGGVGSFSPGGGFLFSVQNPFGSDWSDAALNDKTMDVAYGCSGACGQHLRFFPVMDAGRHVLPGQFVMIVDYLGRNFDLQDDVYLISNLRTAQ